MIYRKYKIYKKPQRLTIFFVEVCIVNLFSENALPQTS